MATKLTKFQKKKIKRLSGAGLTVYKIAKQVGVPKDTVISYIKQERWHGQSKSLRLENKEKDKAKMKRRKCLGGCGEMFWSEHNGNRVCPTCTYDRRYVDVWGIAV